MLEILTRTTLWPAVGFWSLTLTGTVLSFAVAKLAVLAIMDLLWFIRR